MGDIRQETTHVRCLHSHYLRDLTDYLHQQNFLDRKSYNRITERWERRSCLGRGRKCYKRKNITRSRHHLVVPAWCLSYVPSCLRLKTSLEVGQRVFVRCLELHGHDALVPWILELVLISDSRHLGVVLQDHHDYRHCGLSSQNFLLHAYRQKLQLHRHYDH